MQQSRHPNCQPQDQADRYPLNELSVGQQQGEEEQGEEEQREDCKVCSPTLGIETVVP